MIKISKRVSIDTLVDLLETINVRVVTPFIEIDMSEKKSFVVFVKVGIFTYVCTSFSNIEIFLSKLKNLGFEYKKI